MSPLGQTGELLIATDKESEIAFARAAAGALDLPLRTFRTTTEAVQNFRAQSILIVDVALGDVVSLPALPSDRVHLLALDSDFRALAKYFGNSPCGHFILRKVAEMAASDGLFYARTLNQLLRAGESSLVASKFAAQQIETVNFKAMIDKKYAATSLSYFLLENGFNEQTSSTASMAVDELLMNAMVDAPYESQSSSAGNEVSLQVGLDGEALAINVIDSQGSLDCTKLFTHLRANFSEDVNQVRDSANRGAGLGITQIVRAGGSLLFKVQKGKKTEAIVYFRRGKGTREIRKQAQFISTLRSE